MPLKKSLFEAVILLQGFVSALRAGSSLYAFTSFMYFPIDNAFVLIEIPLLLVLWWFVLLAIIVQIRLKTQITTRQALYFEIFKSAVTTVYIVWFIVAYLLFAPKMVHPPLGPISILHRVYSLVLYSVFNCVLFYSTLYVSWKGSREGVISLGEHVESLLPQ